MNTSKRDKVLVVLSGGQDSTTCLLWAKQRYKEVFAVTFDYGQKHRVEIDAATCIASMVGVDLHRIINVSGTLRGRSPLINPHAELETYSDFNQMEGVIKDRVELTFVPLRNMLFLVLAANFALSLDCYDIVTGVCQMDNANYPDCTEDFVCATTFAMQEALGMNREDYIKADRPQLRVLTPLIALTKAETVKLASTFPDWERVMSMSHTCYAGETPPCGKCHACVLRAEGFRQAGIPDPLVERWEAIKARWPAAMASGITLGEIEAFEKDPKHWKHTPPPNTATDLTGQEEA
jgi:7-cyano-7-deazaguanine synthase